MLWLADEKAPPAKPKTARSSDRGRHPSPGESPHFPA